MIVAYPLLLVAVAAPVPAAAAIAVQNAPLVAESGQAAPSYVELADQVLRSPVVIDATIRSAARIKGAEAAGVAPDRVRFYVTADVVALIRGAGAVPARIGYLVDAPRDPGGRTPRLKGRRVLVFARPVPGRPAQFQLTGLDGQRPWTPALDTQVRAIIRESVSPDAPPEITGVGNAFHVPGTLPGEGETQIFLQTANGDPVSLSILRRPGQERRWAVALGEIVDDAARPPERNTLLWYRLACGLPRTLPDSSLANEEPDRAAIAREDYQFVLQDLGPCTRSPDR